MACSKKENADWCFLSFIVAGLIICFVAFILDFSGKRTCPPGFVLKAGKTGCVQCANGFVPNADKTDCECAPGSVVKADKTDCVQCKDGLVPNDDKTDCEACAPGFVPNADKTGCKQCAPGSVPNDDKTDCEACALGLVPNDAQTGCVQCAPGSVPKDDKTDCEACAPGSVPNADKTGCDQCGESQVIQNFQCVDCQNGFSPNDDNSECVCPPKKHFEYTTEDSTVICRKCVSPVSKDLQGRRREFLCLNNTLYTHHELDVPFEYLHVPDNFYLRRLADGNWEYFYCGIETTFNRNKTLKDAGGAIKQYGVCE